MTAHSVLNVRAALEWGNSEQYKYYERNGLGYGTVHPSLHPCESCVAAFLWITTYLVSTISTTSIIDYICSTVQSNTNHTFYPTVQSKRNFYNNTMQEATNSTIGAIRTCVNSTVEHEHLNTVSL